MPVNTFCYCWLELTAEYSAFVDKRNKAFWPLLIDLTRTDDIFPPNYPFIPIRGGRLDDIRTGSRLFIYQRVRPCFLSQTIAFSTCHSVARYVYLLQSLTSLSRSTTHRFTLLVSLARSVHGLTHFAHSLVGQLKLIYVHTEQVSNGNNRVLLLQVRKFSISLFQTALNKAKIQMQMRRARFCVQ